MGKKCASFDSSGSIIAFYDSVDSPAPKSVDVIPITDAEWQQCLSGRGWTVQSGKLTAPIEPTAAELLAQAQAAQVDALGAECQAVIYAGFTSSALGTAHTYPATDTDQRNLTGLVTASLMPALPSGWTAPFWCADATGAWAMREHTAAQIQRAGSDGQAAITALRLKNASLAAQVAAATTVAAVQAIIWTNPA